MASDDDVPTRAHARTGSVIGAFFEVYNALGYGFLEHVYASALEEELVARGHRVDREVSVAIWYKGREIARQRLDMIVDQSLVVELKAGEVLAPTSLRQLSSTICEQHSCRWGCSFISAQDSLSGVASDTEPRCARWPFLK